MAAAAKHACSGMLAKYLLGGLGTNEFTVGGVTYQYGTVVYKMLDALNLIQKKHMTEAQAKEMHLLMVEAVSLFNLAFPAYEQTHVLHQLLEIGRPESCPAWAWAVWP